jgi:hypothetical protein
MCQIIISNNGIPETSLLEITAGDNSDGVGIVTLNDGQFEVFKSVDSYDALDHIANPLFVGKRTYLHFRFATHGKVCSENVHPFEMVDKLGRKYLLFHNGIIPAMGSKEISDTREFSTVLQVYLLSNPDALHSRSFRAFLASVICGSRLLVVRDDGTEFKIGHWYSAYGMKFSSKPPSKKEIRRYSSFSQDWKNDDYQTAIEREWSLWEQGKESEFIPNYRDDTEYRYGIYG